MSQKIALSLKSIPRNTFFEVYDELSHREPKQELPKTSLEKDLAINSPLGKTLPKEHNSENPQKLKIPKLKLDYSNSYNAHTESFENLPKKPPMELIAIEIPLKPEDLTIETPKSQPPNFNQFTQEINPNYLRPPSRSIQNPYSSVSEKSFSKFSQNSNSKFDEKSYQETEDKILKSLDKKSYQEPNDKILINLEKTISKQSGISFNSANTKTKLGKFSEYAVSIGHSNQIISKPMSVKSSSELGSGSEISYGSFIIPKIPKSISSHKSSEKYDQETINRLSFQELDDKNEKITEEDMLLKDYEIEKENNQALLENYQLDFVTPQFENEFDQGFTGKSGILSAIEDSKHMKFEEILTLFFNENMKKKKSACFARCGNLEKNLAEQKLDILFKELGQNPFTIMKLTHRTILKTYLVDVIENEKLPQSMQWRNLGFPNNHEEFLSKPGSPLAMLLGIYIVSTVFRKFFNEIIQSSSVFFDVVLELAVEVFNVSKISKLKKNIFYKDQLENYFKLVTAGVVKWFSIKILSDIDEYEITQFVIERFRDGSLDLMDSAKKYYKI